MSWGRMTKFGFRQLVLSVLPMWLLAWGLGVLTASSVLGLAMVSGWFITMAGVSGVGVYFNYLVPSALIRTFAIGRTLGRYGELMVGHSAIFELLKRLRVDFFCAFARLSGDKRQAIGSSLAQHRLVKDIDTLDEFVLKILSPWIVSLFATFLLGALLAYWLTPWLVLPLFFMLVVALVVAHPALAQALAISDQKRQVFLLEHLPVLPRLLLWGRWQSVSGQFLALDGQKERHLAKADHRRRVAQVILQYLLALSLLLVLWLGVRRVQSGADVAYLLALILGLFAVAESLQVLLVPLAFGRAKLAKTHLQSLICQDTPATILPPLGACQLQIYRAYIKHPNAVVGVADVSFCVRAGRPLVIYGMSGGGKSTLLAALAGQIAPKKGEITLNGFATYGLDWQGQMGFLGQQVDIFHQTLKDNLLLAKPNACDDELWAVLGLVGLDDWARVQPFGLLTPLGEQGAKVSGGQARRIAVARLLLAPKKVLLLDEPFAGLDSDSRTKLWHTLKAHQKEGLLVVVTHHADIIADDVDLLHIGEPVPI